MMIRVILEPRGACTERLHSDTLFGLLCWAVRMVHGNARLEGLLAGFAEGRPPFLLSSAFPYRQLAAAAGARPAREFFLPVPRLPLPAGRDGTERADCKEFRRCEWMPWGEFVALAAGRTTLARFLAEGAWRRWRAPALAGRLRLRARIDRLNGATTGAGTLFAAPELWVQGGGLYFLVQPAAEPAADWLAGAVGFLNDFGWGGQNSIGLGRLEGRLEPADELPAPASPARLVTLSLYHPRADELELLRAAAARYELVRRKGKVGGHFLHTPELDTQDFWKRAVMMVAPGSTFPPLAGRRWYGDNPIVKGRDDGLPFDVQQYGYALTAALAAAEGE